MKWKNKGHEFDEMFENISDKEDFYLFGAGDYGNQFLKIMENEIKVSGYIDNNVKIQGKEINGYICNSLKGVLKSEKTGIIITMSQIARIEPVKQLIKEGYKKDIDFFIIEDFLSVYYLYRYDKVYLSSISFLPSTICNLKCEHCLNFNPYAKNFYVREWDDLVTDIDLFFSCIDRLMLFHLSGGEPLLYKYTADLLIYICEKYGDKIDTIRTVTNGTIVPAEDVLEKLSKCPIEIIVDDYRDAVPQFNKNFEQLIEKLEKYNIKYSINKVDEWISLAPDKTDYSGYTEKELIKHASECNQSWQELRNGKLYNCNYAAYATVAGIAGGQDTEEIYDLTCFTPDKKTELVEFRLGYSTKGYSNFCKKCRGFKENNHDFVMPAKQMK